MTDCEKLENELKVSDQVLEYLEEMLTKHSEKQGRLVMDLNRARRLEREELQS